VVPHAGIANRPVERPAHVRRERDVPSDVVPEPTRGIIPDAPDHERLVVPDQPPHIRRLPAPSGEKGRLRELAPAVIAVHHGRVELTDIRVGEIQPVVLHSLPRTTRTESTFRKPWISWICGERALLGHQPGRERAGPIRVGYLPTLTGLGGPDARNYQPISRSRRKVRSAGGTTACVRLRVIAGSMSMFGIMVTSKCDTDDPCTNVLGA
jgi:hypothetical protein